ncbi:MAG: permease prefix domain 1-containing protein [Planctomycetota bacterium]
MSEREFEAYLNLLARTLKLSDEQRQRIAGELRDHLEERLADLTDAGIDRESAVLTALDEFGDANVLAKDLSEPRRLQRRRRLMQTTFGTLATAAVVGLGFFYLMPAQTRTGQPMLPQATAQAGGLGGANPETRNGAETDPFDQLVSVHFDANPLQEVFEYLRGELKINVFVDWNSLEGLGITSDLPVTMQLDNVRAEAVLQLLADSIGDGTMGFEQRDNILVVADRAQLRHEPMVIETYDCTRLIELGSAVYSQWHGGPSSRRQSFSNPSDELINMILEGLGAAAWDNGESLGLFAGVAVVRQTPKRQEQLRAVLDDVTARLEARVASYNANAAEPAEAPAYAPDGYPPAYTPGSTRRGRTTTQPGISSTENKPNVLGMTLNPGHTAVILDAGNTAGPWLDGAKAALIRGLTQSGSSEHVGSLFAIQASGVIALDGQPFTPGPELSTPLTRFLEPVAAKGRGGLGVSLDAALADGVDEIILITSRANGWGGYLPTLQRKLRTDDKRVTLHVVQLGEPSAELQRFVEGRNGGRYLRPAKQRSGAEAGGYGGRTTRGSFGGLGKSGAKGGGGYGTFGDE